MPQLAEWRDSTPLKGTGSHFWSVNAEEQFYLLAPLVLVWAGPRLGRHPLGWLAIAVVACAANLYGAIAVGVLAAVVEHRRPGVLATRPVKVVLAGVLLACLWLFRFPSAYVYLSPLAGVAIVLLLAVPGRRTRLGALLGGMSYPLYLNHWIGGFVATVLLTPFGLGHSRAVQLPLGMLFSLALAGGLYWWVDRRLLARRAVWATPERCRLAMRASYGLVLTGVAVGLLATLVFRA